MPANGFLVLLLEEWAGGTKIAVDPGISMDRVIDRNSCTAENIILELLNGSR